MKQKTLTIDAYGFGAVYTLTIFEDAKDVRFLCNCENGAGSTNSFCWHRRKIIKGETNFIRNRPENLDEKVSHLLSNANWLPLIHSLFEKEDELERLKDEIKGLKKQVTKAMNGDID